MVLRLIGVEARASFGPRRAFRLLREGSLAGPVQGSRAPTVSTANQSVNENIAPLCFDLAHYTR